MKQIHHFLCGISQDINVGRFRILGGGGGQDLEYSVQKGGGGGKFPAGT